MSDDHRFDDNRFHVLITGETLGGADPEQVAARLAKLFRMPEVKARQLLGGGARVVKKDADEATARKFQVALRQAGARCELKAVTPAAEAAVAAPSASSFAASPTPAPVTASEADAAGELETVGTIRTGGSGFTGAFQVAPVGADLETAGKAAPIAAPDISHLSMAEPGADIETLKRDEPVVLPDTGHLTLRDD